MFLGYVYAIQRSGKKKGAKGEKQENTAWS